MCLTTGWACFAVCVDLASLPSESSKLLAATEGAARACCMSEKGAELVEGAGSAVSLTGSAARGLLL